MIAPMAGMTRPAMEGLRVNPLQAITSVYGHYLDFRGRAMRSEFHDRNRTGWWQLISLVPLGGLLLIYWWALRGDDGPNRFGPPPTAP
jgi:uncharacterized membrane protein YhaH (DUF805 family)